MKMSLYLHDEIYAILRCYGTLDDVVNRVLDAGTEGAFDILDKPKVPDRAGARRFDVDVKNEEYIDAVRRHNYNSPKTSLRRLLYWFVENEMYDVLDWEVVDLYKDRYFDKRNKLLQKTRENLEMYMLYSEGSEYEMASEALKIIKDLEK
jgi:hypothetical protein